MGIGLDAAGDVYVADWRNDRVQKFTPEGTFLAAYGTAGDHDGAFHRPSSIDAAIEWLHGQGVRRIVLCGLGGGATLAALVAAVTLSTGARATDLVDFRADQGVTTTSGSVSGWVDQSGNGYNASAAGTGPVLATATVHGRRCRGSLDMDFGHFHVDSGLLIFRLLDLLRGLAVDEP